MSLPKTVLVTGCSRGMGLEMVRQLAACENVKLIFATCRDPEKAQDLQELSKVHKAIHILPLDIGDDASLAACVKSVTSILDGEKLGLNLVINNAAAKDLEGSRLPEITRKSLLWHMDIHAAAPLLVSQAFLELLKKSADGPQICVQKAAVINMSAKWGSIGGNTDDQRFSGYGYKMGKAALNMATKCLSIDLKADNILCVALCPGWVATDLSPKGSPLTPAASVATLFKTMASLGPQHHGMFLNREGHALAY